VKTAEKQIDDETRSIGRVFGVDAKGLDACIAAEDQRAERASLEVGAAFGVGSTPTMFINGMRIEGAVPLEFLFGVIDEALVAAGKVPPAKYVPVSGK
jgi:protein-disulfide isomerase